VGQRAPNHRSTVSSIESGYPRSNHDSDCSDCLVVEAKRKILFLVIGSPPTVADTSAATSISSRPATNATASDTDRRRPTSREPRKGQLFDPSLWHTRPSDLVTLIQSKTTAAVKELVVKQGRPWHTRPDSENALDRSLQLHGKRSPTYGSNFVEFLGRVYDRGGYALLTY
jgi:hypothetical protein